MFNVLLDVSYADDLLLLAPSRDALQDMLSLSEKYASEQNISFSTDPNPEKSKTKGMVFTPNEKKIEPEKLILNGDPLPWVTHAKYLGNLIENVINGLKNDIKVKRAKFVEKNCELNQEFLYAHPEIKSKLNHIYNSSFPGSILWDITSKNLQMLFNSWSVAVRHMWDVPYNTHRYLIEPLSGLHAKTMVYTRFISFTKSIQKCTKYPVKYMYELIKSDTRTITGKNIRQILIETDHENILDVNINKLKRNMKFRKIPKEELWRINLIKELTDVKRNSLCVDFDDEQCLTTDDINDLVYFVSTS